MHTQILATKVGMTQMYKEDGTLVPVTLLQVGPCKVSLIRTAARDEYDAIQMQLVRNDKVLATRESRIDPAARQYQVGEAVDAPFAEKGLKVDISGLSKGRGYTGVMKRHNFHGLNATHGVKKVHRSGGSTGQNTHPGRVQRGMKMAGQYGNTKVTVRNLAVASYTPESGLIAVCGAVPGPIGGVVVVRKQIEA